MGYTREEIEKKIKVSLIEIDIFYKDEIIKYIGKTSDSDEYYSEIIASEILKKPNLFDKLKKITRSKSYYTNSHHENPISLNENSKRHEPKYAKEIFKKKTTYNHLGKIIDFEVPLKNKQSDKAGKIDLISFHENTLYLIELKYGNNKETLLRAILEIYTYYKTIDYSKLKDDFKHLLPNNEYEIKPAVMVVKDSCKSFLELEELEKNERFNLKKLAKELGITFFKSIDGKTFEKI